METGLKVSIDILCSQFALLVFAGLQDKGESKKLDYRLFLGLLAAIVIELAADSVRLLTDGSTTALGQAALRCSLAVFYAMSPLVTMLYAIYVEYLTFSPDRRPRKRLILYALPAIGIAFMSLASVRFGWLFTLDEGGRYAAGRFSYLGYIILHGYLICALLVAVKRRGTLSSRDFASLVSFPVPIIVLGTVQSFMPEYVILLPAFVLSLLILGTNIHERRLTYDYLTGAYNRRRLDEFLGAMLSEARRSGRPLAAFLADVNDFKRINDRFGHDAGDMALVEVVRIVKSCLRRDDFLARYAGDEFVAVLPNCSESELESIEARIHGAFETASSAQSSYALSISVGGAAFDANVDKEAEGYVKRLDALMYDEKKARKALMSAEH